MSKLISTAQSSKDVVRAGGEIYHLQQARRDHGDEVVLCHVAAGYRSREGLSVSDAFIRGANYLNDIDRMINHGFNFKEMRAVIDAEHADSLPAPVLSVV